jgi:hypothetical protein
VNSRSTRGVVERILDLHMITIRREIAVDASARLEGVEFARAVNDAVKLAAKRSELADLRWSLGRGVHGLPPWIIGFVIRDLELGHAQRLADGVATHVGKNAGIDAAPAVSYIDGDILIGFVERFGDAIPTLNIEQRGF